MACNWVRAEHIARQQQQPTQASYVEQSEKYCEENSIPQLRKPDIGASDPFGLLLQDPQFWEALLCQ